MKRIAILVAALALAPASAAAEGALDLCRGGETECTEYVYPPDAVEGGRVGPDQGLVRGRARRGRQPLLRIRPDFIPELVKSVEDV